MTWLKRIGLFLTVNLLVVVTLSTLLSLLGVRPYLNKQGLDYGALIIFCFVWGMGGAFISLALSRVMAKWMMGVKIIETSSPNPRLARLVNTVHRLAKAAGLSTMPEVGVYTSPDLNAFATGPTRSRALVAVSTGLLENMNDQEIEGVLGHEVAHIANGDMTTMTLLQGVVNAFVMFLSRVIAFSVAQLMRDRDERTGTISHGTFFVVQIITEILFMILGSLVVAAFSRYREFRADAGGARLAGRDPMIQALRKLENTLKNTVEVEPPQAIKAFQISGKNSRWLRWFSTHPPLQERIHRLERNVS